MYGAGREISNNSVVEDATIKDCAIKETLRWARLRQLMHLHRSAKKQQESEFENPKFQALGDILLNESYMSGILKILVGKGDSIFSKTEPMEAESKSDNKEGTKGK